MVERSRVRVPAGAAGSMSSPRSTFLPTHFGVRSGTVLLQQHVKDPGYSVLPKVQVGGRS